MSLEKVNFGRGIVRDIIRALKAHYQVSSMDKLSEKQKLGALCSVLAFSPDQLDRLIADNSPVLRTVEGHAFEVFFDHLMLNNRCVIEKKGGDTDIDRILNRHTLQIKTPTKAGTHGTEVQYKTHKTHGPKSEQESLEYYHTTRSFADFLVGLVTYKPLRILILDRKSIPTHPKDKQRIQSPFTLTWEHHPGLNAFHLLGVKRLNLKVVDHLTRTEDSLLPKTSERLGLSSSVIVDTILQEENFRIWDMSIRGWARELAFTTFLIRKGINPLSSTHCARNRADKSDLALLRVGSRTCEHFQIKGPTLGACDFDAPEPVIGIETQLSRGRANDHPTQSRLYYRKDFEAVIVCLEPLLVQEIRKNSAQSRRWEFYAIPVSDLKSHHKFGNRIASMQKFRYGELQKYRIDESWLKRWARISGRA